MINFQKVGMGVALMSASSLLLNSVAAHAQTAPGVRQGPVYDAPSPAPAAAGMPDRVVLGDYIREGEIPRAARKETISRDSPVVTYADFRAKYKPRPGDPDADSLYRIIAASNRDLCGEADVVIAELLQMDQDYMTADEDYARLTEIYNALPGKLKRGSAVMTVMQAGSSGALCALSLGLYCIAAIAGGVGNIFTNRASLKLQLANVELSLINIRHSRTNIRHSRVTLRMDAMWIRTWAPYCVQVMPGYRDMVLPQMQQR